MPLRCTIHSSDVSINCARSSLVTTRSGTWNAVAMNSVRGIAVPCGRKVIGQDFAPGPPKQGSHGSRSHPRAIRRRAGRAAPPRCPQERPDRCQAGRRRGRLRAAPHLRRGDGTERAVRLERPHRCERSCEPRVACVRRLGESDPDTSGLLRRRSGGRADKKGRSMRLLLALSLLTFPLSFFPVPGLSAQKRAISFDDFIALKAVGDPQLSPDGKWVAYTLTEYSLKDNRGTGRIWLAELGTGQTRRLTEGPGSDRQPRWSPDGTTLAFVSTRQNGPQLWVLPIAGGEARRVTNLADGTSDPLWLPDGTGLIVTSDVKWPADQEIDRRNGDYPTDARIWTDLLWRHWDDWRAGKRQHLFLVTLAGNAKDITTIEHDVPTIATSGDGDVAVAPDGREIAFAMHGDSSVADNTNVDIYLANPDGSGTRALTTARGAEHTPRYSPDGPWPGYLSMERPGFEADRVRLMLVGRKDGRTEGGNVVEATGGWTLSVGSYTWCQIGRASCRGVGQIWSLCW